MKAVLNHLSIVALCWLCTTSALSDDLPRRGKAVLSSEAAPADCMVQHDVGKLVVPRSVTPDIGLFMLEKLYDCFTGKRVVRMVEYPKGSGVGYLWATFLFGGVVGADTLFADAVLLGTDPNQPYLVHRSLLTPDDDDSVSAVSEQDFIGVSNDSLTELRGTSFNLLDRRGHLPMYIQVTFKSYAWSYEYAEDFVLFDIDIRNIGTQTIKAMYVGVWGLTSGIYSHSNSGRKSNGLSGFLRSAVIDLTCPFRDTVNIMWSADDDGDPVGGVFERRLVNGPGGLMRSAPDIVGISFLNSTRAVHPNRRLRVSYNWTFDMPFEDNPFAPRRRTDTRQYLGEDEFRPHSDVDFYYSMQNGDIDYDQARTAIIGPNDPTWRFPKQDIAADIADGNSMVQQTLSIGPWNLSPGAVVSVPVAIVAGENFHTNPDNIDNLPDNPWAYYQSVDFSDLAKNALWADWIYDNPGVDSDNDGYAGEFRVCVHESTFVDGQWTATDADTVWYKGDGVPDWRGAAPPPAPDFWITPTVNGVHVRFNGSRSETEKDIWLRAVDFEGYNVYLGRDERKESLSLIASYDRENFDKWVFNVSASDDDATFELHEPPFTLERLRCLYGEGVDPCNDSAFDPERFGSSRPYRHPLYADSIFFFVRHGQNASQLGVVTPIRKVYPNEPDPGNTPIDSLPPDRFTSEGNLKFYEYEFEINNLLPTLPYYVNVTAFDFGSPASGLSPLESSPTVGIRHLFPLTNERDTDVANRDVYIYPNPYRKDAAYRARGLEGRTDDRHNDRVRRIHFANLPPRCTIRIFTIDGDMVREIAHDVDPSEPLSSHGTWDLISRNGEPAVSGLYYWSVESDTRTQLGKLVIIR
ncbi:MAG: hypothetical protein ACE5FH_06865 [Candidatus Zixiibacteriota bacterium]